MPGRQWTLVCAEDVWSACSSRASTSQHRLTLCCEWMGPDDSVDPTVAIERSALSMEAANLARLLRKFHAAAAAAAAEAEAEAFGTLRRLRAAADCCRPRPSIVRDVARRAARHLVAADTSLTDRRGDSRQNTVLKIALGCLCARAK